MKAAINQGANSWSLGIGPRPEDLEVLADKLENTIIPCSAFELQLLCAELLRRVAKVERDIAARPVNLPAQANQPGVASGDPT